jgi:hypothetical protein
MSLLAITACIALAMFVAGVYGVNVIHHVPQNTGHRRSHGRWGSSWQRPSSGISPGFSTTAIGLVIGLGATLVLIRARRGMLVGLES